MGTRISDPDIISGNDCAYCTGPESTWLSGETPKTVYAVFNNLNACPNFTGPLPNGEAFVLTQEPALPCRGGHDGSVWYISFYAKLPSENFSELLLIWKTLNKIAFQSRLPPCPFEYQGFDNLVLSCTSNVCATDGIGIVSWNSIPQALIREIGLVPGESLFLESFPHEDGSRVVKFCDRKNATNIKIKFDLP